MVEDGIILGGEAVTIDEILLMSEIFEEFSDISRHSLQHERKATRNTDSSSCSTSLSLGLEITATHSRLHVACILGGSSRLPRGFILGTRVVGIPIYTIPRSCDASSGIMYSEDIKRQSDERTHKTQREISPA